MTAVKIAGQHTFPCNSASRRAVTTHTASMIFTYHACNSAECLTSTHPLTKAIVAAGKTYSVSIRDIFDTVHDADAHKLISETT